MAIKKIFKKNSSLGFKALFFIVLSIFLLVCDGAHRCFDRVRSSLAAAIIMPVQYIVNLPMELTNLVTDNIISKRLLVTENTKLRSEKLLLQVQLQKLAFLEQENAQLRVLLSSAKQVQTKVLAAQLLAVAGNNFNQQVTVNKGKKDNVYVGQAILDAYGLMGQVVLVGAGSSKVLLITDVKSAVPALVVRNGMHVIVIGKGQNDLMELTTIPETADIKVGDFLVTSNLGQRFPEGHPVGTITAIKHFAGDRFAKVLVKPAAHINSSHNVLLLWNEDLVTPNQSLGQ